MIASRLRWLSDCLQEGEVIQVVPGLKVGDRFMPSRGLKPQSLVVTRGKTKLDFLAESGGKSDCLLLHSGDKVLPWVPYKHGPAAVGYDKGDLVSVDFEVV